MVHHQPCRNRTKNSGPTDNFGYITEMRKRMNQRIFRATAVFLAMIVTPQSGLCEDDAQEEMHHQSAKSVENLSPELRALLKQEMQALQSGLVAAIPAYTSGDLTEVADIAKNMKDSYILKQSLTREQMHELHTKLPESFLKMDGDFHYYAGMLSHVAKVGKLELVNFYFSKLTESCASCHSEYATHRFPGFASDDDHDEDHDH
jgi:hypothetical protein